ncbi:hypothetical protein J3E68DRAFT_402747 [Trichoderma sp. SZMC 28012]
MMGDSGCKAGAGLVDISMLLWSFWRRLGCSALFSPPLSAPSPCPILQPFSLGI